MNLSVFSVSRVDMMSEAANVVMYLRKKALLVGSRRRGIGGGDLVRLSDNSPQQHSRHERLDVDGLPTPEHRLLYLGGDTDQKQNCVYSIRLSRTSDALTRTRLFMLGLSELTTSPMASARRRVTMLLITKSAHNTTSR